jgi:uncharacterized protein (TIGR02246 family)
MMTLLRGSLGLVVGLALALSPSTTFAQAPVRVDEALQIATDAYVYGYSLVTMEMTRRIMTNVAAPEGKFAPMGQFANLRAYPTPNDKEVTAPNADTLYSLAWLDLAKEPYVVSIPDENNRYFLMPMLSGWTDVFAVPGKRTSGTKAQTYALTGPGWTGTLPAGVTEIKSPTSMVWILARTYCTGTPEDLKAVHAIQDKYTVVPLSSYGKAYTPPAGKVDPSVDGKTPVRDQVNKMDAGSYFQLLAELMKTNPPAAADAAIVAEMAKIGLVPGKSFDPAKVDAHVKEALKEARPAALQAIMAHQAEAGEIVNSWTFSLQTGLYGTDYLQRAFITAIGLGANRPQDAVYPTAEVDVDGAKFDGSKSYQIHFPRGATPPVGAFWSLTMYDPTYFFVPNKLNRHTLSPRDALKYNADGSLNLVIQHESPGKAQEANWLPAPEGNFVLMMRLYWPKPEVLSGAWQPPGVVPVELPSSNGNHVATPRPEDEKAIDALNRAFVAAYNKGDVKAIVDSFDDQAELSDEDQNVVKGKTAIARHFTELFKDEPNATIELAAGPVRFLGADAARQTGRATIVPANGGAPEISRFSVILVRKNGKWLHDIVEESTETNLTTHERLKEIEWMVGDWVDEGDSGVVHTSCRWSEDQNYLLRDYTKSYAGKVVAKGTQRIGWDAGKEQFKSWVFEDDGGHSEGFWTRSGKDEWTIELSGTLADGRSVEATQITTLVNKNTAKWKAVDRSIDGEEEPDLDEITLVKAAPKPGTVPPRAR